MASETTSSTADDLYFAAWFTDQVLDEARPYNVSYPLMRYQGRQSSKAFSFPIQDDPGVAASNQTEGTAYTNTALSTSKATATARLNGQVATVTDILDAVAFVDAVSHFASVLGRSVAEEYETTIDAQYANFSVVVGSSGVDFSLTQFLTAISDLEIAEAVGQFVTVLHPVQTSDLRGGASGGGASTPLGILPGAVANYFQSYLGNPNFDPSIMKGLSMPGGFAGSLFDVDIFHSTAVPTANAGADRAGGMFVKGASNGLYEVWGPRVETHRDIFQPGTQVACTSFYGVAEIRDAWGIGITTDA